MSYKDKLMYIYNEIQIFTGLDTQIICDGPKLIQFITDKRKSRVIDVTSIKTIQDLALYSRLVSLDLTRPI